VIVPLVFGSLLNPEASSRFLSRWKLFCCAYAFLSAFNVRSEQHLYYGPHEQYFRVVAVFDWVPFCFPALSLLMSLLAFSLIGRRRAGKDEV